MHLEISNILLLPIQIFMDLEATKLLFYHMEMELEVYKY
jgi:hypothetical protein